MIDNFDLLADWIRRNKTFTNDTVLFLQIIRRKKDNPTAKAQQTIKNFYIKSADDLLLRREEIINWCNLHNARAYLRLNVRNLRKVGLRAMALMAESISNENYHLKNIYESAAGQYHSDPDKTWIVDLDDDVYSEPVKYEVANTISTLIESVGGNSEILWVNTKNGVHLICRPFNKKKFFELAGYAAPCHPDNPTILYHP